MRWTFTTLTVFSLVSLSAANAMACSCAESVPCQAYGEASAVFIGTVIDSRINTTRQTNHERSRRVVRLSVETSFRGVTGSEVEVTTGMGGGDCGIRFVQNERYLVYAFKREGKLSTGICSRTRPISRAAEDLIYIRGLATAKPGATISGKVVNNSRNKGGEYDIVPLPNIRVTIAGPTKKEVRTNMKGQFRIEGLPAGLYMVRVSVPAALHLTKAPDQRVEVTDHVCGVVNFWLQQPAQKNE